MPQNPLLSVDEGDVTAARAGVAVAIVVGNVAGITAKLADIEGTLALTADNHGKLEGITI